MSNTPVAWGAPITKDNGAAIVEQEKPEDVNPTLFVDQRMGANADQIREFDHTGQSAQPKGDPTNEEVTRVGYADQAQSSQAVAASAPSAPSSGVNTHNDIYTHDETTGGHSSYSYSFKEWVLATDQKPPGPESTWQMGRVWEFLLDTNQMRVKLHSNGKRIVVDVTEGQIRPMGKEEVRAYKKEHKAEYEMPWYMMVVCCPCMAVIWPIYACGCIESTSVMSCCECCECCSDTCECCEACFEGCFECLEDTCECFIDSFCCCC